MFVHFGIGGLTSNTKARHWLMRSKRLGGALLTTAAQPTPRCNRCPICYTCIVIQEICRVPIPSVSMVSQPSNANCRRSLYTSGPEVCCTQFPFWLVQATITAFAHAYTKLPAVLIPFEQSAATTTNKCCPMIHEDSSRIYGGKAIEDGVRRGWEMREGSKTNL